MKRTKKGFTIVELVIVIAVIAILSAVLIPTFSGLIAQAEQTTLQRNLTNAWAGYFSENGQSGEALAEEDAFIAKVSTIAAGAEVYKFDKATANWVTVTVISGDVAQEGKYLASHFTIVCPHEDPEDLESDFVDYNGYFIFGYTA